jgi:hypothetical protein
MLKLVVNFHNYVNISIKGAREGGTQRQEEER